MCDLRYVSDTYYFPFPFVNPLFTAPAALAPAASLRANLIDRPACSVKGVAERRAGQESQGMGAHGAGTGTKLLFLPLPFQAGG